MSIITETTQRVTQLIQEIADLREQRKEIVATIETGDGPVDRGLIAKLLRVDRDIVQFEQELRTLEWDPKYMRAVRSTIKSHRVN